MKTDIVTMTAEQLSHHYQQRHLSPFEVCSKTFEWIEEHNPRLNAFSVLDKQHALEQAVLSEKRWKAKQSLGPLDGVPVTVKDNFNVQGWQTRMGSLLYAHVQPAQQDALLVKNLKQAGANVIGKTTMPEGFWKISNESPLTGVTRNPWNVSCSPGGSSGGGAAAVAMGMGPISVGSDGAGSVRAPASFCGLVGFKPTHGLIPVTPPSRSGDFSTIGPMARSVTDAALLLDVIKHRTSQDPLSLACPAISFAKSLQYSKAWEEPLKIAFTPDMSSPYETDPEVLAIVKRAAKKLSGCFERATLTNDAPIQSHVEAQLAIDVIKTLRFSGLYASFRHLSAEEQRVMDQELLSITKLGEKYMAVDVLDAEYQRSLLNVKFCKFFDHYDVLAMPTIHETAFAVNRPAYPPNAISLPYNMMFFNMSLQPAITIPCGLTKKGMPVGIQLIGQRYDDLKLLQIARQLEQVLAFPYFHFLHH